MRLMQSLKQGYFITGTDTDVGKTLAAAWLMLHLDADYWKPVQCGLDPQTDKQSVEGITGMSESRFHTEEYKLSTPLSPHEAAKRENVEILMEDFKLPETSRPLVVEGAGGLAVPLNKDKFIIDLIAQLGLPSILVCRSGLGTINHTLLSLDAMRAWGLEIAGLIMSGEKSPHNRAALEEYGGVPIIAEIDYLETINKEALLAIKPEIDLAELIKISIDKDE